MGTACAITQDWNKQEWKWMELHCKKNSVISTASELDRWPPAVPDVWGWHCPQLCVRPRWQRNSEPHQRGWTPEVQVRNKIEEQKHVMSSFPKIFNGEISAVVTVVNWKLMLLFSVKIQTKCFSSQSEARTAVSSMGFLMVMMAAEWPVLPPSVWQLSSCLDRSTPATQTTTFAGSSRRSFLI